MLLDVDHLMNATAQSIDRSLDYYWPADAEGDKDLCEGGGLGVSELLMLFVCVATMASHADDNWQVWHL